MLRQIISHIDRESMSLPPPPFNIDHFLMDFITYRHPHDGSVTSDENETKYLTLNWGRGPKWDNERSERTFQNCLNNFVHDCSIKATSLEGKI